MVQIIVDIFAIFRSFFHSPHPPGNFSAVALDNGYGFCTILDLVLL